MKRIKDIFNILLHADTKPTRFWLALINLSFVFYMNSEVALDDMLIMFLSLPIYQNQVWSCLFIINSIFLLYGLTGRYTYKQLFFEGILGWFLWVFTAVTHTITQGTIGPSVIIASMTTWILIRYPTHWKRID